MVDLQRNPYLALVPLHVPLTHLLMKTIIFFFIVCSVVLTAQVSTQYKATASKIISTATADSTAWNKLATMCDTYGHRLSGSDALEKAIDWIIAEAKKEGYNARGEKVMVPHWVRGSESITMNTPRVRQMPMLGLGGSVGTPAEGITADVMVVNSFDELKKRAAEAKGKIVLFNVPFTKYGETVAYRVNGCVEAARAGAVASLVRSVGPFSIQSPHTGMLRYNDSLTKIPHAAITVEDAEMIQRMIKRGQNVSLTIKMSAQMLPDAESRNVLFEIPGTEKPNEVVVMGGHIDSWDVGQGAMDDGGGCFAAWQALNTIKKLGLKPKRTIRVVMWTNEENGVRGGNAYAVAHPTEKHVLGIESDEGTFKPTGFGYEGNPDMKKLVTEIATLLEPLGANDIHDGFGGADVSPLKEKYKTPLLGLEVVADRYFWFHHTHGDTPDKLNPHEVNQCAAAMAIMAYIIADMPTLPDVK